MCYLCVCSFGFVAYLRISTLILPRQVLLNRMHLFASSLNDANNPRFVEGEHLKSSLEFDELAMFNGEDTKYNSVARTPLSHRFTCFEPLSRLANDNNLSFELLRTQSTNIYVAIFSTTMAKMP